MVGDTIENLHKFAKQIGLKRYWFQNKRGKNRPHYDVKGEYIDKALRNGAKLVTRRELLNFLKEKYG